MEQTQATVSDLQEQLVSYMGTSGRQSQIKLTTNEIRDKLLYLKLINLTKMVRASGSVQQ